MRNSNSKNYLIIYISSIIYLCMVLFALPSLDISFFDYVQITRSDQEKIYSYVNLAENGNFDTIPLKFLFMALLLTALESTSSSFPGLGQMQFIFLFKSIIKFIILLYLFSSVRFRSLSFSMCPFLYALILLDPFLYSLSSTLLRDDLIVVFGFFFFIIVIEILWFHEKNARNVLLALILFILLTMLRPFIGLLILFTSLIGLVFSRKITPSFLFTCLISIVLGSIFLYMNPYHFHKFTYYFISINPFDGIFVFHKFYTSPVPWNIPRILSGELDSDSEFSIYWFYFRWAFVVFAVMILIATLKTSFNYFNAYIIYIFLFFTITYGLFSDGAISLGPRQGYLGYIIFLYIVCVRFSKQSSKLRRNLFNET